MEPKIKESKYFKVKISNRSSLQAVKDIKDKLLEAQKNIFRRSCFGHFLALKDINDIRAYESLSLQSSYARLTKEVLVKVYVIKKCLEYRYSAWVVDANFLPFSNDLFLEPIDAISDFYYGESSKLLFVKSSSSVQKIWTKNFLYEVANLVDKVSLPRDHRKFANIMANLLRQKAGVMIKRVDESNIGLDIGTGSANQSSSAVGKKIVYWSADLGSDRIQKQFEALSMWNIDSDSSCKAVICHQS